MKEHIEIEARFLNLDESEIKKRLEEIGAEQKGEYFFREWIMSKEGWEDTQRRVRVRTDGQTHWLTYKANATWAVDSTEEVDITVSSPEDAVKFIQACDIELVRYQEKRRTTYQFDDITFDLDFWPKIPMVLEIEAPSEEGVRKGAELLGLDWEDAVFVDQMFVHIDYYNIDLREQSDYRFEE